MSPRNAGRLFLIVGIGGIVIGLVVAAIAALAVDRIASAADQTLDIAAATIEDVDSALEAAALTTRGAGQSIEGLTLAIADSTGTLDGSQAAIGGMAEVIGSDLADSIQAVVTGLPALVEVGDALDQTVSLLSGVGITDVPLLSAGDAIRDLQSSLDPVPEHLRTQGQALGDLGTDIGDIIDRSAQTTEDLALVREGLREAEVSLARFTSTASRLETLIRDTRDALSLGRTLGFVVVGLLAIVFIGLQAVPIYIGVRLRRPDLPDMVARILRERDAPSAAATDTEASTVPPPT
jgi:hypothetical protein